MILPNTGHYIYLPPVIIIIIIIIMVVYLIDDITRIIQ